MNRLLAALAISAAFAAPAFAETMAKDMTCAAFTAMGHDEMMSAMNDAMMAGDAMASTDTKTTGGAMATDTKTTGGAMASGDAMAMSPEDSMAALAKTCTEHPDMMMMDAMHPKM